MPEPSTQEDLKPNIWESGSYDFISNTSELKDINGHGTHVAGIRAAASDNNIGGSGVAPNTKIMALKVTGDAKDPTNLAPETDILSTWIGDVKKYTRLTGTSHKEII